VCSRNLKNEEALVGVGPKRRTKKERKKGMPIYSYIVASGAKLRIVN
jgi:hypothetical protein